MSSDGLVLGSPRVDRPTDQRQILALSGGGYRGLYTAMVLEAIEDKAGRPLREVFDVLAGTSIGGLLAGGLALGIPAKAIARAIESFGPIIFDRRIRIGRHRLPFSNPLRACYRARYRREPLTEAIDELIGERGATRLNELDTPLLITAVNAGTGQPAVFMSGGLSANPPQLTVRDVLLATSAAPTFFPPHVMQEGTFVDGGLIANAPDLVAVTETIRKLGCQLEHTRLLSIGTAGAPYAVARPGRQPGLIRWLMAHGLVQLTLSAQELLAIDQCAVLLGDRFLRLNHEDQLKESPLALDEADPRATRKLRQAAESTIQSLSHTHRAALRRFLSHQSRGGWRAPLDGGQ